jgi:hypothetical protein
VGGGQLLHTGVRVRESVDNFAHFDSAGLQVLVVLEGVVSSGVMPVGRTLGLGETGVLLALFLLVAHHVAEVQFGEHTEVGNGVVGGCGLEVVQMREAGAVAGAEVEGHVSVSVVDGVALLAFEVLQNIVLHNGVLSDGTGVGTGGLAGDAITDGEDVVVLVVLLSVAVHVNHAFNVANARIKEELVLLGRGVHVSTLEILLDDLTGVYVLEHSDLGVGILTDAHELPSEENLDSTLVAFLKGDLVGVGELEDRLVRGPVLKSGTKG